MAIKNQVIESVNNIFSYANKWDPEKLSPMAHKEYSLTQFKNELLETINAIQANVIDDANSLVLHDLFTNLNKISSHIANAHNNQSYFVACVDAYFLVLKTLNEFGYLNSRLDGIIARSLSDRKNAATAFEEIIKIVNDVKTLKAQAEELKLEIYNLHEECYGEGDPLIEKIESIGKRYDELFAENGVIEQIESAQAKSESLLVEIEGYHEHLLVGDEKEESLKSEITEMAQDIGKKQRHIEAFIAEYIDGYVLPEDEKSDDAKIKPSKKQQVDELHQRFTKYINDEKSQINTYKTEFFSYENSKKLEIEALLKSATNASLASSFEKLKEEIQKKREYAEKLFYVGLALVISAIALPYVPKLSAVIFEADDVYFNLLKRITLTTPFIWFSIHQSLKVSQYFRLEQEYAHKEVVSRSFEGYKSQVLELYSDTGASNQLLERLLSGAIGAIAKNPIEFLDKSKTTSLPSDAIVDGIAKPVTEAANSAISAVVNKIKP
ncbi:hypothetical protein [Cellvibrio sp. OA-2007]|uniref:hypothetical protein n=1 Tax=Cellvibrio sp. OA-2007 TaxID=529823 RepID=UPI0007823413|nr:hypothetical protein [Cellvibrio sp. OA-2007]